MAKRTITLPAPGVRYEYVPNAFSRYVQRVASVLKNRGTRILKKLSEKNIVVDFVSMRTIDRSICPVKREHSNTWENALFQLPTQTYMTPCVQ